MIETLKKIGCPTSSFIRAMRFYSENKRFGDHVWVNEQLKSLDMEPGTVLEQAQKALLTKVINEVRKDIDPTFTPIEFEYNKGEVDMSLIAELAAQMTAAVEKKEKEESKVAKPKAERAPRVPKAEKTPKSKVVKVDNGEPKKNKKAEKFEKVLGMMKEAGNKKDTYVSRELLAEAIGATPGSVGVMVSELRKDKTLKIESTKGGYRILPK